MKIFVMVSNQSSLIINDGFSVAQRFHKDKESGEKKFYPVGTYNAEKARSQYFFLNKSLQEQIIENDMQRIDNVIFKEHNNIAGLKIAFPAPKDTSAYLVFDGYKKENITFIANRDFAEAPCPYNSKVSKQYNLSSSDTDTSFHCKYCGESGPVAITEEDALQFAEEMDLDKSIKTKKLVNKFFHIYHGDIRIYAEADIKVDSFLDTFAVEIKDNETIQFLLLKKTKDEETGSEYERQYLVEFTYHVNQKPNVAITLLENRGFTRAQYTETINEAKNFENSLKYATAPAETETQSVFYFPDKSDGDDMSPFEGLRDMIKEDNE